MGDDVAVAAPRFGEGGYTRVGILSTLTLSKYRRHSPAIGMRGAGLSLQMVLGCYNTTAYRPPFRGSMTI